MGHLKNAIEMRNRTNQSSSFLPDRPNIFLRAWRDFRKGIFWEGFFGFFLNKKKTYKVGMVVFHPTGGRPSDVRVGVGSYGNVNITDKASITIGNFVSIGQNLSVIATGGHNPDLISTYPFYHMIVNEPTNKEYTFDLGKVEIGNDVLIGDDVTILGGVKIGDGVVVGAKSLIPQGKKLDDYGIYAGVPVRLIRYRFNKATIKKLKELRWWELNAEVLKEHWNLFYEKPEIAYKKLLALKENETTSFLQRRKRRGF